MRQLHAHDELLWENNQPTFRRAGGYAYLATVIDRMRKQNPANTILIDTGDMFQGSMLSVKTEGKAFVPLLNALNYDLFLPGNWEVVYYKKAMQHLLGVKIGFLGLPIRSCSSGSRPACAGQQPQHGGGRLYFWSRYPRAGAQTHSG